MDNLNDLNTLIREAVSRIQSPESHPAALYKCERCQDHGLVEVPQDITGSPDRWVTICNCAIEERVERLLKTAPTFVRYALTGHRLKPGYQRKYPPLDKEYAAIRPHDYPVTHGFSKDSQAHVLDALGAEPIESYALLGNTGVGKTFLLYTLAQEAVWAGRKVYYFTLTDLVERLRRTQIGGYEGTGELPTPSPVDGRPVHLFLDEVDMLTGTDFALTQVFSLFNHAYNQPEALRISFASNAGLQTLSEKFGAATARRIEMVCASVEIGGVAWA